MTKGSNYRLSPAEVRPRHARKEVMFDLVVKTAEDKVNDRASTNIA